MSSQMFYGAHLMKRIQATVRNLDLHPPADDPVLHAGNPSLVLGAVSITLVVVHKICPPKLERLPA
jgi:hypothetical protein